MNIAEKQDLFNTETVDINGSSATTLTNYSLMFLTPLSLQL